MAATLVGGRLGMEVDVDSVREVRRGNERMAPRRRAPILLAISLMALMGCADEGDRLVIELVPNPEVNTRDQVSRLVNRLEVVLDVEGGFEALDAVEGDSWGPYEVTDFDGDGVLELKLTRPGGNALDPFVLTKGHQGDRTLHITAMGMDTGQILAALGGTYSMFEEGSRSCEVPFNLLPERRPLRVVTMNPPTGSRDLEPPVDGVTIQLGGEVLEEAVVGRVHLIAESFEVELDPGLVLSYVETGLGRLTNVRLRACALTSGEYTIVVDTDVCTTSGQCLDQLLSVDGEQPFEGRLTVRGDPVMPECEVVGVLSTSFCPDPGCPDGFSCDDDGSCTSEQDIETGGNDGDVLSCDTELCVRPLGVCDGTLCVPDCQPFGVCVDPAQRCDPETGLCR